MQLSDSTNKPPKALSRLTHVAPYPPPPTHTIKPQRNRQVTPERCAFYEALLAGLGFRNSMGLSAAALAEMDAIRDSESSFDDLMLRCGVWGSLGSFVGIGPSDGDGEAE